MSVDNLLAEFNKYAQEIIDKHTQEIKNAYNDKKISSEVRLKVFNEHLDKLKYELQQKVDDLLGDKHQAEYKAKSGLLNSYEQHINEFYKSEF